MDFVKNIKNFYNKFKKYFENRKFRERIKKEKSQKYLFVVPEKKRKIFCFIKNKKFFSNFTVTVGDNVKNYRYYYLAIGLVLFSLSFYIIFISPYFRISPSKVIIERLDTITDINIAYKSVENFYGQSIFLIDKNDIKKTISGLQKNIKKVEVSRLFPSGLKIIIESYSPQFITNFKGIDKNYIITSNGVLIYEKNLDKTLYNLEIVDINLLESGFFDYKEGIDEDSIKKIIFARDLFKDMFSNKNISKFVYFKLERELHIFLESGTIIILELNTDLNKQLAILKYFNDNNNDILSIGELVYIDIRILNKIFICKEKNVCKKNLKRIYTNYYKN